MILELYRSEWKRFKTDYVTIYLVVVGLTLASIAGAYAFFYNHEADAITTIASLRKSLPSHGSHVHDFFMILGHNLTVSATSMFSGLIPMPVIPAYQVVTTAGSAGLLLSLGAHIHKIGTMVLGLAPHGWLELFGGIAYSTTLGVFMSVTLLKKIFSSSRQTVHFWQTVAQCIRSYLLVALPMFIVAAFIESFVTESLLHV